MILDDRALRITHIINDLDIGGAERSLLELIQASQGQITSFVVSLKDHGSLTAEYRKAGIPVFELRLQRNIPNPLKFFELVRVIRSSTPDIVLTWMYHSDLIGSVAAKMVGRIPIVWNIRNLKFDRMAPNRVTLAIVRMNALLSHHLPDKVISNSVAASIEHIRLGYSKPKMQIIPNGFNVTKYAPDKKGRSEIRRELGMDENNLVIGLIARFDPLKDHKTFLIAASRLAAQFEHVRFILAGAGITSENPIIRALIQEDQWSKFHLLGPRQDVPKLMSALDILVSSSKSESFPNVVGEAMASGIPCVVTDVGDSRTLLGEAGVVVDPGDADSLTKACEKLIRLNRAESTALGLLARKRIQTQYSMRAMVSHYIALFEELTNQTN